MPCRRKKIPTSPNWCAVRSARLNGAAQTVTLLLKGLPLAYNKDMQETQEPLFAASTLRPSPMLDLLAPFTEALAIPPQRACSEASENKVILNAMAAATYLVHKGVPFRKAHEKDR